MYRWFDLLSKPQTRVIRLEKPFDLGVVFGKVDKCRNCRHAVYPHDQRLNGWQVFL